MASARRRRAAVGTARGSEPEGSEVPLDPVEFAGLVLGIVGLVVVEVRGVEATGWGGSVVGTGLAGLVAVLLIGYRRAARRAAIAAGAPGPERPVSSDRVADERSPADDGDGVAG